jgi:hypothetical protein
MIIYCVDVYTVEKTNLKGFGSTDHFIKYSSGDSVDEAESKVINWLADNNITAKNVRVCQIAEQQDITKYHHPENIL